MTEKISLIKTIGFIFFAGFSAYLAIIIPVDNFSDILDHFHEFLTLLISLGIAILFSIYPNPEYQEELNKTEENTNGNDKG